MQRVYALLYMITFLFSCSCIINLWWQKNVQHINRHISAAIEGEGRLVGLINSDLRRTTPFTSHEDDTYFGRAMAIVQTTRKAGLITLTLNVEGLPEPVVVRLSGR